MGGRSLSPVCQLCNFALVFFFFLSSFFPFFHLNFERVEKNVDLSATSVTRFLIFDGGFAHFELQPSSLERLFPVILFLFFLFLEGT